VTERREPIRRVDERDTMFARMRRKPGTAAYEDMYRRRPELREVDDDLRALPRLMGPGGKYYDADLFEPAMQHFRDLDEIETPPALVAEWSGRLREAEKPEALLEEMARSLGAVAAGVTRVEPRFVYSHRGRRDESYGEPIPLDHDFAIVFLVEMNHEEMLHTPGPRSVTETALQYLRSARISIAMEAVLRACGHRAESQHDAHYSMMLPPLAVSAGLGELGRNNILIAHRFGSRVRIGAVATDLPLEPGRPVSLGARRFCKICRKCAETCPSRALSQSAPEEVRGVLKWSTDVERCHAYWLRSGTDCGICMAICPFSHRNSLLHNLVRWCVRYVPFAARPALFFDDLIYGRKWRRGRCGVQKET
jgi:reductive dehalogenase